MKKPLRKIIEIDEELCDGCGQCVPSCAEGSLQIVEGKARVVSDNLCDGLGACLGECPRGALRIVEREAAEFDPAAVERHLVSQTGEPDAIQPSASGGCPSAALRMFAPAGACQQANQARAIEGSESALTHWPVQVHLVPAQAPFLRGADLLVVADCVPVAFPHLHRDFLKNRVVMVGCPKFDDVPAYMEKFTEIFSTAAVNSVTTLRMEVPCCSGLSVIVRKSLAASGSKIPLKEVVISTRGDILEKSQPGEAGNDE